MAAKVAVTEVDFGWKKLVEICQLLILKIEKRYRMSAITMWLVCSISIFLFRTSLVTLPEFGV